MKLEKNVRLFIVEGLPGAGKSTTSKYVAGVVERTGKEVIWVDEGTGDHPADYEFHSFLRKDELSNFAENERMEIISHSIEKEDGILVPLKFFSGKVFDHLLSYKIYDGLAWEKEKMLMLQKWREFVQQAKKDAIYVFNCCLLQNPMCETMVRFGYEEKISTQFIQNIAEIIAPMNPVVIYLQQTDVKSAIHNICKERPEDWVSGVIQYHTEGAYGREHNLKGIDGYINCLEERQRRELRIIQKLPCEKIVIKDAQNNWDVAYEKISQYIIGLLQTETSEGFDSGLTQMVDIPIKK
jgi:energy-coupling factor transporter ATP-binding protein EcfA2